MFCIKEYNPKRTRDSSILNMNCTICERSGEDQYFEKHHLIPKCKRGSETILVCRACGDNLHQVFTIQELTKKYNTLEKILSNEKIQKWIVWIRKKPIENNVCMRRKK